MSTFIETKKPLMLISPQVDPESLLGNAPQFVNARVAHNNRCDERGLTYSYLPEYFAPSPITPNAFRHEALAAIVNNPRVTLEEMSQSLLENPNYQGDLPPLEVRQQLFVKMKNWYNGTSQI